MDTPKLALDISEAAALIGVSRPTMYAIINREDTHMDFYIGRRRKIDRKALAEWIEAQTRAAKE